MDVPTKHGDLNHCYLLVELSFFSSLDPFPETRQWLDCPYCRAAGRPLLEKPLEKPWFPRNVLDPEVGKTMEKPIGKAMVPMSYIFREYFKEIIGIGTKKVGGLGLNMGRKWWINSWIPLG